MMGGLRRLMGLQQGGPTAYSQESAAEVTFDSAMQLSAVWACVKLLSETVASLPLSIYRRTDDGGRALDTNHPLSILFSGKPNRYQTKVEFFETVLLNLVLHGNAYCGITRMGGRIVSLMPMMSAQVRVAILADGSVVYEYHKSDGVEVLASESVWHLKLMGNGVIGLSPLDYQRNTLGIAQAAENAVTKIYRNGAKPSGVLSMDRVLTPKQREEIRANFSSLTTGSDDRLMVLEGGVKFDAISLSPQDIELLSSRKFQLNEICRWYGVPSVMVNDTSGSTVWGSGIGQIVEGFYKLTMRPILEKIEASIDANLMGPREVGTRFSEFDFDALLRTDFKTRLESYRIGVQGSIFTPNECRKEEGLPPVQGGDQLYIQGATVPLTMAGQNQQRTEVAPNAIQDTTN
jgi:HK97 family phage portal protein